MYEIDELQSVRRQSCAARPRLFFALYYVPPQDDRAFEFAARTWLNDEQARSPGVGDRYELRSFTTESQFRNVWSELKLLATSQNIEVQSAAILSHASIQRDGRDGLEMRPDPGTDGTLRAGEIRGLGRMPWCGEGAHLVLMGCNSGVRGGRSWTPAGTFAQTQGVPTLGQSGSAYFSKTWPRYTEKSPSDRRIVLWAYERGRNSLFGSGRRMPGVLFRPTTFPSSPTPPQPSMPRAFGHH